MDNGIYSLIHIFVIFVSFIFMIVFDACTLVSDTKKEKRINFNIALCSTLICLASFIFYMVGVCKVNSQSWTINDAPSSVEHIVSLNDNNMTHGRIYLRSGYIDTDLYFQYIVDLGNGGYKTNRVLSDKSIIYYDDDDCRIEWYKKTRKWLYWENEEWLYKIYVPEGSITSDFTVDLQ